MTLSKDPYSDYKIIASGSSGNAVRVEDMLFDIGVSYKELKDDLYHIKYIFITHRHSDHINPKTLIAIQKHFPRIKWIANYDVAQRMPIDEVIGDTTRIALKDRMVQSFPCAHDIPTHGFVIEMDGKTMIYATDTHNLNRAPKIKYDAMFLESNHDEKKIEIVREGARKKYGYDAWAGAMRHLSTQRSKAFYFMHRRSSESLWVELHKSNRFY